MEKAILGESLPLSVVKSIQPVFIVGTSKSGTSLLLSLFDAHPNCVTLFETAVYDFPQQHYESRSDLLNQIELFFAHRFAELHVADKVTLSLFTEQADRMIREQGMPSPTQIPRFLLKAILTVAINGRPEEQQNQLTHFIEKTPHHYNCAKQIFEDYPQAKIVHVLRDPRDNYLSLKRRLTKSESSQFNKADYHPILFMRKEILYSLNAAHANQAKYGDRYRVVFYEDLINDPSSFLSRLIDWMALSWDPALLRPSIAGSNWGGNSTAKDLTNQLKPFDKRPVGRWQLELTHREIRLMEQIITSFNLQSRYPVGKSITLIEFVARLALPFSQEIKREMHQIRQDGRTLAVPFVLLIRYIRHRLAVLSQLSLRATITCPDATWQV